MIINYNRNPIIKKEKKLQQQLPTRLSKAVPLYKIIVFKYLHI